MAEKILVGENGTVEHLVWPGDGQPPIKTEYRSDRDYLQARSISRTDALREVGDELRGEVTKGARIIGHRLLLIIGVERHAA